jgi:outer membrane receptor protein involved in Fe transport
VLGGVAVAALVIAQPASAQQRSFNVPAEDARQAIPEFARQAGVQISAPAETGIKTNAVKGKLDIDAALRELIRGTGLEIASSSGGMIVLRHVEIPPGNAGAATKAASLGEGTAGSAAAAIGSADQQAIIVTAQKRSERLLDVPVPVSVLDSRELVENNYVRIQDYYTRVPGLNLTTDYRGAPQISLRGITTGINSGNPTVSVTIDDVPYGSSSALSAAMPIPELDPADLARIEILRGPQGTLYGASSLGGLIKYVTSDPSPRVLRGRIESDLSAVDGGGLGYGVRGALNVPLSADLAVRTSAFYRRDPGYIDNSLTGQKNVNYGETFGGFASALWRPSDDFSAKISALVQKQLLFGSPFADPNSNELQLPALRGSNKTIFGVQAYSAVLKEDIGKAEITSLTGYSINYFRGSADLTGAFLTGLADNGLGDFPGFGTQGAGVLDNHRIRTRKFSEELRLSLPIGSSVDWLVGAFYTHENSLWYNPASGGLIAVDPSTGVYAGTFWTFTFPFTYREYATFTDLTVHLSKRFSVQVGGRMSWNKQSYSEVDTGLFGPLFFGLPDPVVTPETRSSDHSATFLITPQYRLSSTAMVYARIASGYRPGGPNQGCVPFQTPCSYGPDRTINYEVGAKAQLLDHRLTIDGSIYQIDWQNPQLLGAVPPIFYGFYFNGARARSRGIELAVEARPTRRLTITGNAALGEAKLTRDLPVQSVVPAGAGDRLPYTSRFSGNLSAEQRFPLFPQAEGYVGASVSYVGKRYGEFLPERQVLPSYVQADVRLGAHVHSWTANFFVQNLFDKRGVLSSSTIRDMPVLQYIRPRTFGLSLSSDF